MLEKITDRLPFSIREILSAKTFRQSGITIIGTFASAFLGWIFYIITARALGPAQYGVFTVATTAIALVASIVNVGTDSGIIRFVGENFNKDKQKAVKFLKLAFNTKLVASLFTVLFGIIAGGFIANNLLSKPELAIPLTLAITGVGATLLFNFAAATLQALQRFVSWSLLLIFNNVLRLIVFLLFFLLGSVTVTNTLLIFILAPLIAFSLGVLQLPSFISVKGESKLAGKFYGYNKWIAIFGIISAIAARLDTFITARFLSLEEVGIYGVAVGLSSLVVQFVLAIGTVLAPKLTQFTNKKEAIVFIKKAQMFVIGLAVIGLATGIPLAYFAIPAIYGEEFSASFLPFVILLVGQAIFLISVPVHNTILYYFSKPQVFVWVTAIHLLIIALAGWLLISTFGIVGAAVTVTLGMIYNLIVPTIWVVKEFNKR